MPNEEKIVEKKEEKTSNTSAPENSETETSEQKEVPETYTITVDGMVREVTLDELRKMAELSGGAQKRFQEAAALAKENAKAMELYKTPKPWNSTKSSARAKNNPAASPKKNGRDSPNSPA